METAVLKYQGYDFIMRIKSALKYYLHFQTFPKTSL